jgi:hypothetical protein
MGQDINAEVVPNAGRGISGVRKGYLATLNEFGLIFELSGDRMDGRAVAGKSH